jgi:hypothetical protein
MPKLIMVSSLRRLVITPNRFKFRTGLNLIAEVNLDYGYYIEKAVQLWSLQKRIWGC